MDLELALFEMSGGYFLCKKDEPFKLACCDCGLGHLILIQTVDAETIKVGMWRDEDTTEVDRQEIPEEALLALRKEINQRLRILRREKKG